jgi:hypothetical protein
MGLSKNMPKYLGYWPTNMCFTGAWKAHFGLVVATTGGLCNPCCDAILVI